MAVHEQAWLAPDRDDKPRPTPESSRGSTTEAAEQRVERPSVSSDLGPDCEEILAGRPFYLLLLTGRHECEHGHWRARARVGREAGVCVSDARCQCLAPSGAGRGLLPPATAWGAFWCGTRGVSRQAGRQVFARSAIYSCFLVARRRNWRVRRSGYLYIRRNKSQGEGHWPAPRAPYLRPSAQHPPEEALE